VSPVKTQCQKQSRSGAPPNYPNTHILGCLHSGLKNSHLCLSQTKFHTFWRVGVGEHLNTSRHLNSGARLPLSATELALHAEVGLRPWTLGKRSPLTPARPHTVLPVGAMTAALQVCGIAPHQFLAIAPPRSCLSQEYVISLWQPGSQGGGQLSTDCLVHSLLWA
jgi:hypothetical protein